MLFIVTILAAGSPPKTTTLGLVALELPLIVPVPPPDIVYVIE
jgi:hypothetical protein